MPELPEVETIRQQLREKILGKKISRVEVKVAKLVKKPSPKEFCRQLSGKKIGDIRRRGKYLIFKLFPSGYLLVHLKISGRLLYSPPSVPLDDSYYLSFFFTDRSVLYYQDIRRFGGFSLLGKDPEPELKLGPEPLSAEFTFFSYQKILRGRKTRIKPFLMDQAVVAGLGNIYANEVLFHARIHPDRKSSSLTEGEQKILYQAIQSVLKEALSAGGTSIVDYVKPDGRDGTFQERLFVYGRNGQPCRICKNPIMVKKDGSRSTYFCAHCQKING